MEECWWRDGGVNGWRSEGVSAWVEGLRGGGVSG